MIPSPTKASEKLKIWDYWFSFKKSTRVLLWIEKLMGRKGYCRECAYWSCVTREDKYGVCKLKTAPTRYTHWCKEFDDEILGNDTEVVGTGKEEACSKT